MAGGGGAWKVAYADFVTAMMAFFMVMWIVAQSEPIKQAIAGYFNDPSGKATRIGNGKSNGVIKSDAGPPPGPRNPTTKDNGKNPAHAKSTETDGEGKGVARARYMLGRFDGNNLVVDSIVPFQEDSGELDERGKDALDRIVVSLLGKFSKIEVRGHASARPLSQESAYHNPWELCYARSMAVMKYLVEKGVEVRRLRLSQSGPNEPATAVLNDALEAPNCRVEIFVLSEMMDNVSETGDSRADRTKNRAAKDFVKPYNSDRGDE
jgi:chemotaxis protein MotB